MTNPLDAWTARCIGLGDSPLTRADLTAYQLRQLRATLAWAKERSPYYRHRLGVFDEARLTTLDRLRELPLTSADDLRRNDPPLLCVSQSAIAHIVTLPTLLTLETSGTRGPPKRLFFTADEQQATIDFFDYGMRLPARAGDRVLILFPGERSGSVGDLLGRALTRLGATPIAHGWPHDLAAASEALYRERPDVVAGTPVALLALARHGALAGLPRLPVRSVLISADHAAASLRRSLAELWGCEIFEHYGMTEMGLGGGVDCAAHAGYHLREHELLVEVVDPASGERVAAGQPGEVVFTTLARRGLPLIRYRTGDISSIVAGPCACGSPLVRLERIHGRLGGGVRLGETGELGELTMARLDEAVFSVANVVDFDAVYRPGEAPRLELAVSVADDAARDATLAAVTAALAHLAPLAAARSISGLRLNVAAAAGGGLLPRAGKRTLRVERAP